jgi:hypothetical protein
MRPERGVVLLLVLLVMTLIGSAAMSLALASSVSRLSAVNHDEAMMLTNAAEAALELAAREIALLELDQVLGGAQTSRLTDGAPGTRTVAPGVIIDLQRQTSQITCGRSTPCTTAQVRQITADRPWGANNPFWRLFLHQRLEPPPGAGQASPYVVAWIGDDAREVDGDPLRDGAGAVDEGRYIVRVRAEAFGPRGGRRAIEAELFRRCNVDGGSEVCIPGSRVQSWRLVSSSIS